MEEEKPKIKEEITNQTIGYVTAAFGLVAGLAWNEAVKSLIEFIFPFSAGSILLKFAYAILMTVVLVVITLYLKRILKK